MAPSGEPCWQIRAGTARGSEGTGRPSRDQVMESGDISAIIDVRHSFYVYKIIIRMIRPNQQYQPFCITVRLRALCRNICPAVRGSTSRKGNSWGSFQWRRRWLQESDGTAVGSDHSSSHKTKMLQKARIRFIFATCGTSTA